MNSTSTTDPATWAPKATPLPALTYVDEARVTAFIAAHNLESYVDASVQLARNVFPHAKRIVLSMFGEPSEYGERVILDVTPGRDSEAGERQYRDFVADWTATTPPWATDRMGISIAHT